MDGRLERILRENGMTPGALIRLSYQFAQTYQRTHPNFPSSKLEDLSAHVLEVTLRRALGYDAAKNPNFDAAKNPTSTPFRSWCWLQMGYAGADFVRQRKEGFIGRIGRDLQITVTPTDTFDDEEDPHDAYDAAVDRIAETRFNPAQIDRWRAAAEQENLTLAEFLAEALELRTQFAGLAEADDVDLSWVKPRNCERCAKKRAADKRKAQARKERALAAAA